jgi:hypothetical protein
MARSRDTFALEQMGNPDRPDGAVLDIVRNGDMIIKVGNETKARLLRVSSQTLKEGSKYFEARLGPNWGSQDKTFTVSSPLTVDADYDVGFVLFMLILHAVPLKDPRTGLRIKLKHFRKLAALVDMYMYHGDIPAYITQRLDGHLAENHVPVILKSVFLLDILTISYLLNLADLFAKTSRQIMWCLTSKDLPVASLEPGMLALLPIDIFAAFDRESHRLRSSLLKSLPIVFYPEPHIGSSGEDNAWWCKTCDAVPHEQRWMQEVVSKSEMWTEEQASPLLYSIDRLFSSHLADMEMLDTSRECTLEGHQTACGHFRPRYIDVNHDEMLQDVFRAMGGVCMHCFKTGRFKYEVYCEQHGLSLT